MTIWKDRLIEGYREFRAGDFKDQKALYEKLGTHGQNPKVMLIACSDSRADPSDIFNAYPGEMFVLRNVANIVPPSNTTDNFEGVAAAIEYAVTVLKIEALVIMGHESCGGIQGCLDGMGHDPDAGYVGKWVSIINNVRDRVLARNLPDDQISFEMELEGIRQSMTNLMTFLFVREAVESGRLKLQGAYFSIIQAKLMMSDDAGKFKLIEA